MEKLKALKRAAQAIYHLLLSFEFMEKKSEHLVRNLQIIRNLLPVGNQDTLISKMKTDTEKVQSAKNEVKWEIQRCQDGLSRIIRFFLASEPMAESSEKYNELDIKNINLLTCAINHIIINSMEEFENFLIVEENCDLKSINLALPECLPTSTLPLNIPSGSKKCKISSSTEDIGPQSDAVFQKNIDKNDKISKKTQKPKPPKEQALENEVVLLEIFRHSSSADLKHFRLVNRKWNDTATSTLLVRKSLQLVLQEPRRAIIIVGCDSKPSATRLSSHVKLKNGSVGSLTDLCSVVKSSRKFPTKSLTFKNNYAEFHLQRRQLLMAFGNQLKEFTYLCRDEVSTSFLRQLLLDLVPNLESLIIVDFTLGEKKQPLSTAGKAFEYDRIDSLPHLKQVVFLPSVEKFSLADTNSNYQLNMEFFKELVNAAVNLRSVYTLPLDFLEVLLDTGKVQLVKEFTFAPKRKAEKRLGGTVKVNSVAIYQKLVGMKPEIKKLDVNLHFLNTNQNEVRRLDPIRSKFESALNSVLEFTKDSLRDLSLAIHPHFLVVLPEFPNVEKLSISRYPYVDQQDFGAVLPTHNPAFSFQSSFPRLQELDLQLCFYMDVDIKGLFGGELEKWVHPTVKHLTFRVSMSNQDEGETDSPYTGPQMLGQMFPNVTSVVIAYGPYMFYKKQLSSIIWHQIPASVKRLSIIGLDIYALDEDIVDTFFTGMTNERCKQLRTFPQRIGGKKESVMLDELRTGPSICAFKNLEELNIFIDFRTDRLFASRVTGLYAFDLMPHLKVTVTYKPGLESLLSNWKIETASQDMKRSLKQIAPFITQVCR